MGIAVIVGGERIEAAVIDLRPLVYIDGVGKVQLRALFARVVFAVRSQGAGEFIKKSKCEWVFGSNGVRIQ